MLALADRLHKLPAEIEALPEEEFRELMIFYAIRKEL